MVSPFGTGECFARLLTLNLYHARTATALKLCNFCERGGGGFAGHKRNDDDFAACFLDGLALILVQRIQRVIASFDVNVRLRVGEELNIPGVS